MPPQTSSAVPATSKLRPNTMASANKAGTIQVEAPRARSVSRRRKTCSIGRASAKPSAMTSRLFSRAGKRAKDLEGDVDGAGGVGPKRLDGLRRDRGEVDRDEQGAQQAQHNRAERACASVRLACTHRLPIHLSPPIRFSSCKSPESLSGGG